MYNIVSCEWCNKKYKLAEESKIINGKAKVRCKNCNNIFSIFIKKKRVGNNSKKYTPRFDRLIDCKSRNQPQNTFPTSTKSTNKTQDNQNVKIGIRKKFNFALVFIMMISLFGTYITSNLL